MVTAKFRPMSKIGLGEPRTAVHGVWHESNACESGEAE